MNDLGTLNDIEIDIKQVNKSIKWCEGMRKNFLYLYKGDTTKLELQIKDLENRRKRIVRRMYKKYCT